MSGNAEARQNALDRVLDAVAPTAEVGEELFAVADALSGSPSLRRALIDAGTAESARRDVVQALFGGRVSGLALSVLSDATGLHWATTGAFVAAIAPNTKGSSAMGGKKSRVWTRATSSLTR